MIEVAVQISRAINVAVQVNVAGGGAVEIRDIDTNELIATVAAPGEFLVEQLIVIEDTIDNNTTTIIDPIV